MSVHEKNLEIGFEQEMPIFAVGGEECVIAGDDTFIFELLAGPGADSRPTYTDLHASYKTAGWHHVCFRVGSVDAAIVQLKHRAVTVVSQPHDVVAMGLRVAFFADPWGNLFEFTQPLGHRS